MTRLAGNYSSRSRNGRIELKILNQPEEQHRARYLTEGSRGSIKDNTGLGHPVVKLFGYNHTPVKLQCFIGHDKNIGLPHLFYQASRITGKNSTRCSATKIDGTAVISLDLNPENNMQTTVDCIGILKERNVDVEQKVLRFKSLNSLYNGSEMASFPSKKRCAKCRLVFRCKIPGTNEVLQAVSTSILCTQPVGTPEICKMSLAECQISGGQELYIIGKNFLKDSKVIFKTDNWCKIVEADKEFLHSTHLICTIPAYDGPNHELPGYFIVSISIRSGGKYSDSHTFTYINDSKAKSMSIQRSLPPIDHSQGSNPIMFQKQIFMSMMNTSSCNGIKSEPCRLDYNNMSKLFLNNSTPMETSRYYHSEDSLLSSDSSTVSEAVLASEESCFQDTQTFGFTPSPTRDESIEMMTDFIGRINQTAPLIHSNNSNDSFQFKGSSPSVTFNGDDNGSITSSDCDSFIPSHPSPIADIHQTIVKPGIKTEQDMFGISNINLINNCDTSLTTNPSITLTPSQFMPPPLLPATIQGSKDTSSVSSSSSSSSCPSPPNHPIINPNTTCSSNTCSSSVITVSSNLRVSNPGDPSSLIPTSTLLPSSESLVKQTTATNPTVMQASQINVMSQLSDNELIRLINPSTFDEFKEDISMFNYGYSNPLISFAK